ncbi:type VI secretion system membrane subunit TssM [Massilia luteola]|uniref:type VI secretion system membrane subunit TssM n=1 Tax=Massilia luteola TaxID=3081751 RepID=UPI002ACC0E49|nr:type VI secretion system membrane subunit TssM [Massilia sp. Gc5]
MQKIWHFLTARTSLTVIGWAAFAALLFAAARLLQWPPALPWIVLGAALLVGAALWLWRRWRHARKAGQIGAMLEQQAGPQADQPVADATQRQETEVIRKRLLDAIATIKGSKLGQLSGSAALYELPWYMIIGNPAAGKSTAIASSGLQFPFADSKVVQGVGGTRNCDWFFTTEGILLDTAGRYSVVDQDRAEWFGFLDLLKKHRRKAPINGVIIAVSIAELTRNRPEFAINLAKNLRQRVQELTERLEVHAPVYVVFTKADLIDGFNEFFQESERAEREKVWGATLPYDQNVTSERLLDQFDARFDELYDGLKELSLANMSQQAREAMPSGVFTFPLEFASIKPALHAFVATLFEDNPFQFKPVFRGFYFTSALQEGETVSTSSARVAQRFDLRLQAPAHEDQHQQQGYFLLNLFRKVIFADKDLVAQYASPAKTRLRYAAFFAATALVGLALAGWSWSYMNNRQLVANVQADLDQAIRVQGKSMDLQSRFQALEILQDRIEQLDRYAEHRPLSLGLGLYQGNLLDRKLKEEYFNGVREVMLKPVAQSLESYLADVNGNAAQLQPMNKPAGAPAAGATAAADAPQQFKDASPLDTEDAYNALKTYLMLGDKSRAESAHLNDQLTRFWRNWLEANRGAMPREQLIRSAERMISFYLAQVNDPSWPVIDTRLALVDQTRDSLRRVVRGMPARERVYADVKARAATRYPSITVARIVGDQDKELVLGSYAISGAFTRQAWEGFVQQAFRDAANRELQSADWVLKTAARDDLTLEGSPEQIQKSLVDLYKAEYAREWQKFMQGVTVKDLDGFDGAASAMNRLGDPQNSPINKLVSTVYEQTSWDNPTLAGASLQRAQNGLTGWFRETILRQKPAIVNVSLPAQGTQTATTPALGPVGREFAGVARLVVARDKDASLMRGYIDNLSKLRARFNQIKNQGDPGPGAKQLMQQTLDGSGSELADALRYVDEQMLVGMTDAQRQALRPVLVRPLMQTFAVIVQPAENEINKVWAAQVVQPFNRGLALKYPFATESKAEASNAEIGEIFGPDGAIAKFFTTTVGPLVVRRGDSLSPRTWADMGVNLAPNVVASFPGWVAPLAAGGVANAAASSGGEAQTRFDLQALATSGATEFTLEIDGQALRWRGQPQPWVHMVWPNPAGVPGAKITAVTPEGRNVVLLDEPGHFGLKKMIDAAQRKRKDGGVFEMSWQNAGVTVTANLKVLPAAPALVQAQAPAPGQGFKRLRLPDTITTPRTAPLRTAMAGDAQ